MSHLDRFRAATLATVGGFIVVSAVQSACSSAPGDGSGGGTSDLATDHSVVCPSGQTARTTDGTAVCCSGDSCSTPSYVAVGAACGRLGETRSVDQRWFSIDTCVIDSCSGDMTSQGYPAVAVHDVGTLVCQAGGGGGQAWGWKAAPESHEVDRACAVTGALVCGSDGYGYGYESSGYGTYGYGYDGYGYDDGGRVKRAILVTDQTCQASASGSTSICTSDGL